MKKKAQEQLMAEIQEEVRNFSEELVMREAVERTDFTIVTVADKGSFIAAGQNMLTDFMTEDECRQMIENKDWKLIASWVMVLVKYFTKEFSNN